MWLHERLVHRKGHRPRDDADGSRHTADDGSHIELHGRMVPADAGHSHPYRSYRNLGDDADVYGASMRSRAWIGAGIAVTVLGLAAVLFAYPLSPRTDPAPVQAAFFPRSFAEPGVILVNNPGSYAIWGTGMTGDGDRCRVSTQGGTEIRVDEPRLAVRWEPHGEDSGVYVYTQTGAFDVPAAGAYGISCTTGGAPGTAFVVTRTPSTGLSLTALVGGSVAIVLGVTTLIVASVRRRR